MFIIHGSVYFVCKLYTINVSLALKFFFAGNRYKNTFQFARRWVVEHLNITGKKNFELFVISEKLEDVKAFYNSQKKTLMGKPFNAGK